jgi:hypothetical protein
MDDNYYEKVLGHIAQPADPRERRNTKSATLSDWEALLFRDVLYEYGHYGADGDERAIALGMADYIERRTEEALASSQPQVNIYAHTNDAVETLFAAHRHVVTNDAYPSDAMGKILDSIIHMTDEGGDDE